VAELSQLQETLEAANRAARAMRLEALQQLDQLMETARRDAEATRARAEEEAQAIRAAAERAAAEQRELQETARREALSIVSQAEAEARAIREEATERQARVEQRLEAAGIELRRVEAALTHALQAVSDATRQLVPESREGDLPAPAGVVAPPPGAEPVAAMDVADRPERGTEASDAAPERVVAPSERPRSTVLEVADGLLQEGEITAALDTFRTVGRHPDEIEPVVARLTEMLHDPGYAQHHGWVRSLLADLYMLQGDTERARTLLRQGAANQ
jgi:hypothetical protein